MILTDEERIRFIAYCLQQVLDNAKIVKQLADINMAFVPVAETLKRKSIAYKIVMEDLQGIISEEVKP